MRARLQRLKVPAAFAKTLTEAIQGPLFDLLQQRTTDGDRNELLDPAIARLCEEKRWDNSQARRHLVEVLSTGLSGDDTALGETYSVLTGKAACKTVPHAVEKLKKLFHASSDAAIIEALSRGGITVALYYAGQGRTSQSWSFTDLDHWSSEKFKVMTTRKLVMHLLAYSALKLLSSAEEEGEEQAEPEDYGSGSDEGLTTPTPPRPAREKEKSSRQRLVRATRSATPTATPSARVDSGTGNEVSRLAHQVLSLAQQVQELTEQLAKSGANAQQHTHVTKRPRLSPDSDSDSSERSDGLWANSTLGAARNLPARRGEDPPASGESPYSSPLFGGPLHVAEPLSTFSFDNLKNLLRHHGEYSSSVVVSPAMRAELQRIEIVAPMISSFDAFNAPLEASMLETLHLMVRQEPGLLIPDICGLVHQVLLIAKTPPSPRPPQATLFNPNGSPLLASIGLPRTSAHIAFRSYHLMGIFFDTEQNKVLTGLGMIAFKDSPATTDAARFISAYKQAMNLMVSRHCPGGLQRDPYHISKWSLILLFHLHRWFRAILELRLAILVEDLQLQFDRIIGPLLTDGAYLRRIFPLALQILEYRCPKGHLGGCHKACDSCGKTDQPLLASGAEASEYKTALAEWRRVTRETYQRQHPRSKPPKELTTEEAYAKSPNAIPRPLQSTSATSSPMEYLANNQHLIPAHCTLCQVW